MFKKPRDTNNLKKERTNNGKSSTDRKRGKRTEGSMDWSRSAGHGEKTEKDME
jgi:hypothetical protein